MQQRINLMKVGADAYKALAQFQAYVERTGLEHSLLDLVKIRASQINGCAYCLVMHTNDARDHGESDERMHLLNAWQEAPVFTKRERAALGLIDAVTRVAETHVPDDVYEAARKEFWEQQLVELTAAIVAINAWNRVSITFRAMPQLKTAKIAA